MSDIHIHSHTEPESEVRAFRAVVEAVLPRPPEAVFDYPANLENNPAWNWSVTVTTSLTPGPNRPRSTVLAGLGGGTGRPPDTRIESPGSFPSARSKSHPVPLVSHLPVRTAARRGGHHQSDRPRRGPARPSRRSSRSLRREGQDQHWSQPGYSPHRSHPQPARRRLDKPSPHTEVER